MGVFDFIKGMFAKEPEIVEELSLENINEWFEKKHSLKKDFIKGQAEGINARIGEKIAAANQNIVALNNAQLRNSNIPEKAKHFMQGNREAYIKRLGMFLESINVPTDAALLSNFTEDFDKSVDEFGKATARPFAILKEFFEEDVMRLAGNIREIDQIVGETKTIIQSSKLNEMGEAGHEIAMLKNKMKHKEMLANEITKRDGRIEDLRKEKKKLEENIEKMEGSAEFKDHQMLKGRLEEVKKQSKEKESDIAHSFASLERPMKKYVRVVYNDKDILEAYIKSPVAGLSHDFGLKIIGLLENMKKAIVDDSIELKDKQKVKAIEDIRSLDKEYLSSFVSTYAKLKKKENDILKEMNSMTIVDNITQSKEKLNVTAAMLEKAKQDSERMLEEISKIDISKMKEELAEKLKSATNVKVIIS